MPAAEIPFNKLGFLPRFEYGHQAQIAEVTGRAQGTVLGSGFARFSDAKIPCTIKYDEVLLVLEGQVTIETSDGDLVAGPQDCIWLPAGTELTYLSESALVFFAIHPANWAEQGS